MIEQTSIPEDRARYANMTREERLHEFKQVIVAHPHLMSVYRSCREVIHEPGGALLVFICGPTGVGKTIMKDQVIKTRVAEKSLMFRGDYGQVSVVSIPVRPPLNGSFSWNDFLQSAKMALELSSIDRKDAFDSGDDEENTSLTHSKEHQIQRRFLKGTKDDALRISLETDIRRYRPAAVIIDNAQHLGKVSRKQQLHNQLECIRTLAEITETVHILIGTYELLPLYYASTQVIGRSLIIHFPRYGSTDKDLSQFKCVLSKFQELLPFEEEIDILLKHWEFCYERSLGCVGILHDMLVRAVHAALWANEQTLSQKYLEKYALSAAQCYEVMRQIYEGEKELAPRSAPTELRQMLGLMPQVLFDLRSASGMKERRSRRDETE